MLHNTEGGSEANFPSMGVRDGGGNPSPKFAKHNTICQHISKCFLAKTKVLKLYINPLVTINQRIYG